MCWNGIPQDFTDTQLQFSSFQISKEFRKIVQDLKKLDHPLNGPDPAVLANYITGHSNISIYQANHLCLYTVGQLTFENKNFEDFADTYRTLIIFILKVYDLLVQYLVICSCSKVYPWNNLFYFKSILDNPQNFISSKIILSCPTVCYNYITWNNILLLHL